MASNELSGRDALVLLIRAREILYFALVETPDACRHFIDEVFVVGHQQHRAFELLQRNVQRVDRFEIQMVRGLVKYQHVRLLQHQFAEDQPGCFAARERIGLFHDLLRR